MTVKPQRIRVIHVPIYETDDMVLSQMPPNAVNQWARTLILRQLQIDAQMIHGFSEGGGEEVTREEVKRVIQDELEPILAKLDDSMNRVIDEKIALMQQTIMQSIQDVLQNSIESSHNEQGKTIIEPSSQETKREQKGEVPAWQLAFRQGLHE